MVLRGIHSKGSRHHSKGRNRRGRFQQVTHGMLKMGGGSRQSSVNVKESWTGWKAAGPALFSLGPYAVALIVAVLVSLGMFLPKGTGPVSIIQIISLVTLWLALLGYLLVLCGFLRSPARCIKSGMYGAYSLLPVGNSFLRLGLLGLAALIPTLQLTGFPFSLFQPLLFLLLAVVAALWGKGREGRFLLGAGLIGSLCLIVGEICNGGSMAASYGSSSANDSTGLHSSMGVGTYIASFAFFALLSMVIFRLSSVFRDKVCTWVSSCEEARNRLMLGQEADELGLVVSPHNNGGHRYSNVSGEWELTGAGFASGPDTDTYTHTNSNDNGDAGAGVAVAAVVAGEVVQVGGGGGGDAGAARKTGEVTHQIDGLHDRDMVRMNKAVGAIKQSIETVLGLLHDSLSLNTCALLWLSSSGDKFRVRAGICNSNRLRQDAFNAREGLPGSVLAQNERVIVSKLKFGFKGLSYYRDGDEVRSFMGLPVRLHDGRTGGVLVLDKRADDSFDDSTAEKAERVIEFILRAMENERNLMVSEKGRIVQEKFHGALKSLNSALEPEQVYEAALNAVGQVVPYDFGALTLYNRSNQKHFVVRVSGPGEEELRGLSFRDNVGLVSQVTRTLHHMPVGQISGNSEDTVLFIPEVRQKGFASFMVLPLPFGDQAIGTLCLAAREAGVFHDEVRQRLDVVASAVAISIENARNYARVMEMATTDGLTGLCNHRHFQNLFDQYLARARRSNKKMSFILADIDFFKKVNDTYGHPAGDAVLKNVAAVLAKSVREVDTVARYGGEEFAVLLEETDVEGALRIAERMRRMISASPVNAGGEGTIRVTLSLGVAQYPDDGAEKVELIKNADAALYCSKEEGRNRVTLASKVRAARGIA